MRDEARIKERISAILAGSGLPMDRRAEVAEEWRNHLGLSIAAKRERGLTKEAAVAAALDEFGSPRVIRRQLRRQQRMLDRRQASAKVRRMIWYLLIYAVVFTSLLVVFAPEVVPLVDRCLIGFELFIIVFMLMVWATYASEIFNARIERQRPRAEYSFFRSWLRWMAVTLFGALTGIPFVLGIFAVLAPLLAAKWRTEVSGGLMALQLWHNVAAAWMELGVRNFSLCAFGVIVSGLAIAHHERSRCVEQPDPSFSA